MNGRIAFEKITNLSDDLLMDAAIDTNIPLPRQKSKLADFFGSAWGVALICGIVAFGTLAAIVWAGNRPTTPPNPPLGTNAETEVEDIGTGDADSTSHTEIVTDAITNPENISLGLTFTSNGKGKCTLSGIGTCKDSVLVIPNISPDGDIVTTIGERAFYNCQQITEVVFPSTLTTIEDGAFIVCENLKTVTIPASVHTIGHNAFESCTRLRNVTFEGKIIRNLGEFVFSGTDIIQIDLPISQKKIPKGLFSHCMSLESVTIPESVTSIEYAAFMSCRSLTTINYLSDKSDWDAITKQDDWNYQAGPYTVQFVEGEQVTEGEEIVVDGSQGLYYGHYNDKNRYCYVVGLGTCTDKDIIIPSVAPNGYTVRYIFEGALSGTDIQSVTLHDNLTGIAEGAFKDCTSLEAVYGCSALTSIGDEAFAGCTALVDFDFGNRLSSIGVSAFENTALTRVTLGSSVDTVEDNAFANCVYLTEVILPSECYLGNEVFSQCFSLKSVTLPKTIDEIGTSFFYRCNALESINIPRSVKTLGFLSLYACGNLTDIYYAGTLKEWNKIEKGDDWNLGMFEYAAIHCSDVTIYQSTGDTTPPDRQMIYKSYGDGTCAIIDQGSILDRDLVIPTTSPTGEKVTMIDGAFIFNTRLTSVVIPEGVTKIGVSSFNECKNLKSVTIPASVTSIDIIAFENCTSLTDIYYGGSKADWESMERHPKWNEGMGSYTVHCSDGDIVVNS